MAFFRRNRSRRSIAVLLLLILLVAGGTFLFNNLKKASAEWFNQSWYFRKAVNISNTGTAQTDYQVMITLDTATLITAGKLQSDCDDIRITDINGKLLPYWVETGTNGCNTATTSIWAKVSSIPTSGQTVYVYYGNPSAASAQNGNNVFIFFDDFNSGNLDESKWTAGSDGANTVSVAGGNLTVTTTGGQSWGGVVGKTGYTPPALLEARVTAVSGVAAGIAQANGNSLSNQMYFFNYWSSGFANGSISGGLNNLSGPLIATGIEGIVWIDGSNQKVSHNYSYTSESATAYSLPTLVYPTLGIGCCSSSTSITYDWTRIRKYAATEPTIGSTGSEEKSPGPVAYWKFDEGQGYSTANSTSQVTGSYTNLVQNPSTENDTSLLSEWEQDTSTLSRATDTTKFVSGSKSMKLTYTFVNGVADQHYTNSVISAATNTAYTFSGWIYIESYSGTIQFGIATCETPWPTACNENYTAVSSASNVGKWVYASVSITTNSSQNLIVPFVRFNSGNAVAYTDAMQFVANPTGVLPFCDGSLTGQGTHAWNGTAHASTSTCSGTNGAAISNPSWQTEDQCIAGKCLKFDGSASHIDVGNPTNLQFTDNFTYELWIKMNDLSVDSQAAISNSWQPVMWSNYTGRFRWDIDKGGGTRSTVAAISPTQAGVWYHLAGTYNTADGGSAAKFYVNGVLQGSDASVGALSPSGNVTIGKLAYQAATNTNGFIDEVKFYPYVRTADQIKADYNAGKSGGGGSAANALGAKTQDWMSNGLVGYWKMDEVSWSGSAGEVIDSSGNGNNGVRGGDATTAGGKFGNGGTFDGTGDYVNAGTGVNVSTSGFTISAWMKSTSGLTPTATAAWYGGIRKGGGGTASYGFGWAGWNAGWVVDFYDTDGNRYTDNTNIAVEAGEWHHIVGLYDGAYLRIYKDGVLIHSSNVGSHTLRTSVGEVDIGLIDAGYWNGLLDEVRIYNRALSPKEVSDLYSWAPGPVGHWKMDDKVMGDNQTIIDSSGYGNNGITESANGTGMNCRIIGRFGGGCVFDGVDDYVDAGNNSSLTFVKKATMEAWVYKKSNGTAGNWPSVVGKNQFRIYHNPPGNPDMNAYVVVSGTGHWPQFSNNFPLNEWHHLVVTFDGDLASQNIKLYYDGNLVTTDNASGTLDAGTEKVAIGGYWGGVSFDGYIDDVRIYNYVRTQKQIMEDMNAGHPSVGSPVGSYAGYWKFDEGHDNIIKDQSVNVNTGTNYGASWTNDGKFGKALSFDGDNDYVDAGNPASLNPTTAITLELWLNPNGSYGTGDYVSPLHKGGNDQWYFRLDPPTGILYLYIKLGAGNSWDYAVWTPSPIPLNSWTHAVFTYDGNYNRLYINGVNVHSRQTAGGEIAVSSGNLFIGAASASSWFSHGLIDEVKIYPFALTADDVKTEYNHGKGIVMGSVSDTSGLAGGSVASNSAAAAYCIPGDTASCAPPVGEWNFNEKVSGDSQTVYDTSGNGNNGTTEWGANATGMNCTKPGKYGTGCKFDGVDDYVDAGNATNLQMSTQLTAEFWVKLTQTANYEYLVAKGTAQTAGWWFQKNDTTSTVIFAIGKTAPHWSIGSSISLNTWTHVAATYNAGTVYFYINGVLTGSASDAPVVIPDTATYNLNIGRSPAVGYPFNGSIDDVKIYNYVRTPAQIAWDYNRGKPVGYWKFDECQGVVAHDSADAAASGTGNDGIITIGATVPQTTAGTCTTPTDGTGAWYNGRAGKFNSAMSFDGEDDWINVGNSSSLTSAITDNLTAEAWVYPHVLAGSSTWQDAACQYGDGSSGWILRTSDMDSGHFVPHVYIGGNWYNCDGGLLPLNTWSHILLTYDGEALKGYVNGVYVCQNTNPSGDLSLTGATSIGGNYGGGEPFDGLVDDVRIYNYILTPAQIKLDYNQGAAVRFGPNAGRP